MLQSTKLNGVEVLKKSLTSNMKMKNLKIAPWVFGLALVQYYGDQNKNGPVASLSCWIFLWDLPASQ